MKRLSLLIALFCTLAIGATIVTSETKQKKMPKTVQGIDYVSTLPDDGRRAAASSDYPEDPDDLTTPEGDFTFDKIESWTGEGENQAALVIQWNDPKETAALVFGYRWNGTATGADMIRAVVAANPQLYGLIQYTNVSSPTDPDGGYTINGFGWDNDNDADIALIDTGHDNEEYTSETGLFIHPRGYVPGQGGSSDYDYDNWKARDADDFWGAGWYISYWSYWVKDTQEANFSYSSWGASGRVLQNGSWDGWNFSLNMMPSDWKNFKAAPSPMPDDAKKEFKADGIYYVLLDYNKKTVAVSAPHEMEGETLTAYTGDIEVPATFEDGGMTYTVTAIGNEAFMNSSITAVTLPETVVKIGKSAFENSTLRTLSKRSADATVASTGTDRFDNITAIGAAAFKNCGLFKDIFYPSSIKKLDASVFEGTAVEEVSVPLHIEAIGESTFASCPQLTKVVLPKTLKAIGDKAFAGCDAISTIRCESTIPVAITDETFGTATYQNAGIEVPSGYTDTYKAAAGWKNFARYTEFILPVNAGDRFVMNGISFRVTSVSETGNSVCVTYMPIEGRSNRENLKAANAAYGGDIVVPAQVEYQNVKFDVTEVNDSAFFEAAAITSLTFPDRITRIGNNVCYDCTGIESLTLPAALKEIGDYAFAYNSKLMGVTLPEGLETLGLRAFMSCAALKQAVLPATIKKIDNYAFYGCGLETITLPDGVDTIGSNVFQSCRSLVSAKLPATLKAVPAYMFSSCPALTTVSNMENVTEIKSSAFEGCTSLKTDIPSGVTALGTSAFKNCKAIETITIPSAIKSIPNSLLEGCTALKTVTMAADVETFGNSLFSGCTNLSALVYAGGETAAETTDGSDGNVITLPASLKEIGNYCFNKCTAIAGFNLNDGLTKIGNYAFADNSNLKSIRLPETVTSIGNYAFRATGLTELVLPAGVTYLGNYIAQNCTGIVFYTCNPKPVSCSGTTFSPSGYNGTSTIVVPTGSKEAYEAASYWKKNTIISPAANSLTIGGDIVTKLENGKTTAALPFSFGYDMDNLPAQFAKANDSVVAGTSTFVLNYKDGGREAETVVPAVKDGLLLITGLELEKGKEYTAALNATMADGVTTLTSNDFTLARGKAEHPVTRIDIVGIIGDSIVLNPKHLIGLIGKVTPEDADIKDFDVTLEGNGTGKDDCIATMYSVNYWDEDNNRIRFNELSGHRQGECKLILKAKDGSGYTREYKVKVQDQDRTPVAENTYLDGTIILNEEWFGHTNGGMNFVTKDKQMMYQVYERENPGMSFGCTSQYGTIWNGKLLVASKQAADGGDPLPGGGRLVVADAKTFKRIGSIDEIRLETEGKSGDGRAIAGATPDKAYMGTNQGIYIIDLNDIKVTGKIGTGDAVNADLYSGQIGDMVHAGNHVFAIKQKTGTFIIDVNTDEVVKTIEDADVQGVTQSADGNVWIATLDGKASKFVCIDPATLEERAELTTVMPEEIGAVTCGWGAWRTTQFFGCNSKNVLWFSPGSSVSNGGAGAFYSWEIGTDPTGIKPVFDLKNPTLPSHNRNVAQATYGTSRYDDRSGELIVMTTEYKASGHYRYNWTHFVNPTTGEITKTIDLEPYYWFQAVPIFPDKEEPKLAEGFNGVEFDVTDSAFDTAQAEEIDLAALVSDADNNDYNITFALPAETETAENGTTTGDTGTETATGAVECSLDGTILTVKPAAYGSTVVNVNATSNGRVSTIAIPVTVGGTNAIGNAVRATGALRADGNRIVISGCKGTTFTVCNAAGAVMTQFTADSDEFVARFNFRSGVYIISGNGTSVKFTVK